MDSAESKWNFKQPTKHSSIRQAAIKCKFDKIIYNLINSKTLLKCQF